jgi:hypothetical protein
MPRIISIQSISPDLARLTAVMLTLATVSASTVADGASAADAIAGVSSTGTTAQDGTGTSQPARQSALGVRVQPSAREFAWPNRPDVDVSKAREIDELYRELIGNRSSSGSTALSNDNAR